MRLFAPSHRRADANALYPPEAVTDHDTLPAVTDHDTFLDVLICTFDNAASLDGVLTALGAQRSPGAPWRVLVVDNNSRDATQQVAARQNALVRGGDERQNAALIASYEWGRCAGTARIALLLATRRCEFFGGARRTCEDPAA